MDIDKQNDESYIGPDLDLFKENIPDNMTEEQINLINNIYAQNMQQNMIDHNQYKLIDCPREIVFKIEGTVYNQNSQQEIIATEGIFDQSYHIPVPSGVEYIPYINTFMKQFISCLEATSQESWKQNND